MFFLLVLKLLTLILVAMVMSTAAHLKRTLVGRVSWDCLVEHIMILLMDCRSRSSPIFVKINRVLFSITAADIFFTIDFSFFTSKSSPVI